MAVFISIFVGAIAVFQSGLNRKIAVRVGLPSAALMNGLVLVSLATTFFLVHRWLSRGATHPSLIEEMGRGWFLLPGLFGFCIVLGFPYAISSIGASRVFVLAVAAQLVVSVGWDYFVEAQAVPWLRIVGVAVTIVGAFLANLRPVG